MIKRWTVLIVDDPAASVVMDYQFRIGPGHDHRQRRLVHRAARVRAVSERFDVIWERFLVGIDEDGRIQHSHARPNNATPNNVVHAKRRRADRAVRRGSHLGGACPARYE